MKKKEVIFKKVSFFKNEDLIKKKKSQLTRKRNITKEQKQKIEQYNEESQEIKTNLNKLYKLSKEKPDLRFHHLYKIICSESTLWACHDNIRRNAGSMTGGIDKKDTADKVSEDRIKRLIKDLVSEQYEPKPVKRIYIPKPGKKKMRPLGIPNYSDKLIQDAVRMILGSIYEPLFDTEHSNYGFRPGLGCHDAISSIRDNARGMIYAIEGDIEGAYDNVNFDILESILSEKIEDKKFIRLIRKMFNAGYIDKHQWIRTEKGVPQGSIVSPLLFNIYATGLDKHIRTMLNTKFDKINETEKRSDNTKKSILYERNRSRIREQDNKVNRIYKKHNSDYENLFSEDQEKIQEIHKEKRRLIRIRQKTKSVSQNKTPLRFHYVRYADDWIIFNNWHKQGNEEIKKAISDYLENTLKLKLSEEKTLITNVTKENTKFLGFTFRNNQSTQKHSTYTDTKNTKITRRIATDIWIGIEHERVIKRMQTKNFITTEKKPKPKKNSLIQLLKPHEIVLKYSQMIMGFANYYYEYLSNAGDLGKYYYYMYYSCLHTLAAREKTSIRKLIFKYGKDIKVNYEEYTMDQKYLKKQYDFDKAQGKDKSKFEVEKVWKHERFPRFKEIRTQGEKLRTIHNKQNLLRKLINNKDKGYEKASEKLEKQLIEDLYLYGRNTVFKSTLENQFDYVLNTRSRKQVIRFCPMCKQEASDSLILESHHITPLKKVRNSKIDRFEDFMRDINRLQIPLCQKCHRKVHNKNWAGASYAEHQKFKEAIIDIESISTQDRDVLFSS